MSDFLDHLLAQVLPAARGAIEPRAPSRFEPPTWLAESGPEQVPTTDPAPAAIAAHAAVVETQAPRPRHPRPTQPSLPETPGMPRAVAAEIAAEPVPSANRPRRGRPMERDEPAPMASAVEPPAPIVQLVAPVERHPAEALVTMTVETSVHERIDTLHERVIRETVQDIAQPAAQPSQSAESMPVEVVVPETSPPPPLAAASVQPQLPPVGVELPPAPPPAPIVEVRIGRIEIHAPESPAAPAVAAAPLAAAGGSRLDRFLARG